MKILKLSFVIITLLLMGCNSRQTYGELTRIDSLLDNNLLDSAQQMLSMVHKNHFNKECSMYYKLLVTRTDYMAYKPIQLSTIEECISYFKKHNETSKLVQAYYYKAEYLYDLGERKKAIIAIKRGEYLANDLSNTSLKGRIYVFLARINTDAGDYNKAMTYARKSLSLVENCNDIIKRIDIYNRMAISYYNLGNEDSARFYCNKIIPFAAYVPNGAKGTVYNNIGYFNLEKNPTLALHFLNLAMKAEPNADIYDNLARIYIKQGQKEKADSLWQRALQTDDLSKKVEFLEIILKQKQTEKNEKLVSQYATWLVNLKDSLAEQRQNEQIKELQMQFDHETELAHQENEKRRLMYLACGCGLLAIIAFLISRIKILKDKKKMVEKENELLLKKHKLLEMQNIIAKYTEHIQALKKQGKTDVAIIEKLQQKIAKLQEAQDTYSHKGELLYQVAKKGLSIREWNKLEQLAFLSYYASIDIEYSLILEGSGNYTPRQKIFLILQHEGWSDNKIAEMMGLSFGALRTMKSRINKLKDEME